MRCKARETVRSAGFLSTFALFKFACNLIGATLSRRYGFADQAKPAGKLPTSNLTVLYGIRSLNLNSCNFATAG